MIILHYFSQKLSTASEILQWISRLVNRSSNQTKGTKFTVRKVNRKHHLWAEVPDFGQDCTWGQKSRVHKVESSEQKSYALQWCEFLHVNTSNMLAIPSLKKSCWKILTIDWCRTALGPVFRSCRTFPLVCVRPEQAALGRELYFLPNPPAKAASEVTSLTRWSQ